MQSIIPEDHEKYVFIVLRHIAAAAAMLIKINNIKDNIRRRRYNSARHRNEANDFSVK